MESIIITAIYIGKEELQPIARKKKILDAYANVERCEFVNGKIYEMSLTTSKDKIFLTVINEPKLTCKYFSIFEFLKYWSDISALGIS